MELPILRDVTFQIWWDFFITSVATAYGSFFPDLPPQIFVLAIPNALDSSQVFVSSLHIDSSFNSWFWIIFTTKFCRKFSSELEQLKSIFNLLYIFIIDPVLFVNHEQIVSKIWMLDLSKYFFRKRRLNLFIVCLLVNLLHYCSESKTVNIVKNPS